MIKKLERMELEEQYHTISSFLRKIYSVLDEQPSNIGIELRPINREGYDFESNRSLNMWSHDNYNQKRLSDYLEKHNNYNTCLYYSIFMLDTDKVTTTKNGKRSVRGKVNNKNAYATTFFVADFDDISMKELEVVYNTLEQINVEPIWLFSGHGYQAIFLLDEIIYDKAALKDFIYLLNKKGLPVDLKCIDPARLMRLPYTFNRKGWKEGDVPQTKILTDSNTRYSLKELMDKVNVLDDVEHDEVESVKEVKTTKTITPKPLPNKVSSTFKEVAINKVEKPKLTKQVLDKEVSFRRVALFNIYPIDIELLPGPVQSMMLYTPSGFRNNVMGFLVGFLKNYLKTDIDEIHSIMTIWKDNACVPAYEVEVDSEVERFYNNDGLPYSSELTKLYGFINFDGGLEIKTRKRVWIPNQIFEGKEFANIEPNTLRLIIAAYHLKFLRKPITVDNLSAHLSVSDKTIRRAIPSALKTGYIFEDRKPVNLKAGESKQYVISSLKGYRKFDISHAALSKLLKELKPNEFKVYMHLFLITEKLVSGDSIILGQRELAVNVGYSKSNITPLIGKIVDNGDFILLSEITTPDKNKMSSYTLLV